MSKSLSLTSQSPSGVCRLHAIGYRVQQCLLPYSVPSPFNHSLKITPHSLGTPEGYLPHIPLPPFQNVAIPLHFTCVTSKACTYIKVSRNLKVLLPYIDVTVTQYIHASMYPIYRIIHLFSVFCPKVYKNSDSIQIKYN